MLYTTATAFFGEEKYRAPVAGKILGRQGGTILILRTCLAEEIPLQTNQAIGVARRDLMHHDGFELRLVGHTMSGGGLDQSDI